MNQSTGTPANITDASAASDTRSAQARRLSAAADVIYENVDHDSGIDYGAAEEIARAVVEALSKVPDDAPTSDVRAALRTAVDQLEAVRAVVKRYAGWYEGGPEDSWRVERDLRTALGMEQYDGGDDD